MCSAVPQSFTAFPYSYSSPVPVLRFTTHVNGYVNVNGYESKSKSGEANAGLDCRFEQGQNARVGGGV